VKHNDQTGAGLGTQSRVKIKSSSGNQDSSLFERIGRDNIGGRKMITGFLIHSRSMRYGSNPYLLRKPEAAGNTSRVAMVKSSRSRAR
jgi:hypothetical protein